MKRCEVCGIKVARRVRAKDGLMCCPKCAAPNFKKEMPQPLPPGQAKSVETHRFSSASPNITEVPKKEPHPKPFSKYEADAIAAIADGREPPDPPMYRKPSSFSALLNKKDAGLAPHLIIVARAGTGKTTTLIEGLKVVKGMGTKFQPSPQQDAIWESMKLSKEAQSICFVAFNKSIATELQNRVPAGCSAMTMHSMGFKAVQAMFGRVKVDSYRVQNTIAQILETDLRELWKTKVTVLKATEELVGLCKMNLINGTYSKSASPGYFGEQWDLQLAELASYYDIDLNGNGAEVFNLVPQVLEQCKNVRRDNCIDFDDMIWLPIVLNLPITQYDLLLVDEAQDLNRCQQRLAKRAGRRLILCGDPKQAIYGFAGADCESMNRMKEVLTGFNGRDCIELPLTVTRRCGKAIVREAQKIVPDFEAFETNPEGIISTALFKGEDQVKEDNASAKPSYAVRVQDGDMCLCRVNAPLVQQCFRFLKMGRKANIQGRDVGQGLISTIKKLQKKMEPSKADNVLALSMELDDWYCKEQEKENAKKQPNENKLIALTDRRECLEMFMEDQDTVSAVIARIESVFTDNKDNPGIKFSSIHKSKGLESKRVFFLRPDKAPCPHPLAKSNWAREQEMNLVYVATTRAIEELVYVS